MEFQFQYAPLALTTVRNPFSRIAETGKHERSPDGPTLCWSKEETPTKYSPQAPHLQNRDPTGNLASMHNFHKKRAEKGSVNLRRLDQVIEICHSP